MIVKLGELHRDQRVYYYDEHANNIKESLTYGVVQRYEPLYAFGLARLYLKYITHVARPYPARIFYDVLTLQLTNDYHIATPLFSSRNEMIEHSVMALQSTISELEALKTDE